ncbi:MAG: AraC family transcriptional regulator [Candidatus Pristimantibacillus lignocellulolyticus]|uniref:AraC family transcriptional regulator n=1 Tax=Candidatus Pristimantibacillus lignocellulolyticus TaxID=2994561 RepID=A0A9J6ZHH9_9BACL|nr:MAG: AraC family transcriptional regulator [Candidatus Pristimantibacillus lignocellulolyticus]
MYRILIADDEALEREGMEWIINNMMPGQFEIIQAENGRDAIQKSLIYKPHIIMMDIRMPGIDGLTALKNIISALPHTRMVLLTAYDYFEYAKEALKMGVRDYFVKPANRNDIVKLLHALIDEIATEQATLQQQQLKDQQLSELIPLVKTELALGLMSDNITNEDIYSLADSLQLRIEQCCAIVIALPQSYQLRKELYDTFTLQLHNHIQEIYHYVASTVFNDHIAVFIMAAEANYSLHTMRSHIGALCQLLLNINLFNIGYNEPIAIGVGNIHHNVHGARRSYFEAVFASTNANEKQRLCLFQDMEQQVTQPLLLSASDRMSYVQVAIQQIRQEREHQTFNMIDHAIQYIEKNYKRELSLEETAEHVHLNPYYFSKVFKQQTGETFIDYVTNIRIHHAKQWMTNKDLSLKEICYLVGYNDPNYFSRVFKKVVGKTPSEYRSTI